MKKANFKVVMALPKEGADVEYLPWSGYLTDVAGLVVCRAPWKDSDGPWYPGDVWQVIHERGGWVISKCRIHRRYKAVELAEALGRLGVDWTKPIEDLSNDVVRAKIRAAVKEVGL